MKPRKITAKSPVANKRSPCPIANALDLLGDKWSLLVIRDLMFTDKRQYGEFLASPEGIPTNILAERLKRLEGYGIISKQPYQERPVRYRYQLTERGHDLRPVLVAMIQWANQHMPDTYQIPSAMLANED